MEKFHYFLHGKEFKLETDQKPVVSIYKKHMVDISPRVQRLIVRSFPYLPFKVVYKKGKDIPVADALSQVTPMDPEDNIQLPIIAVNMVTTHILKSAHPQDTFSNKLDQLKKSTAQDNQLTRLSCYINTGFPCDKKNLSTDLHRLWNHRETLSIKSRITVMMDIMMSTVHMITTHCLMSEHFLDSISNRLAQLGKNTSQKKHITRLKDHNNIDQLCDRENLLTDLPESWPYKEPLHNKSELINYGEKIRTVMYQYIHKEFYILPRPSKAMTQGKFQHVHKEVYILLRPSKLQPMANYSIASPFQLVTQQDLPQLPSTLRAQEMYQYTHKELYFLPEPSERKRNYPLWAKRSAREPILVNTNIGSTQTKYILGTSYSREPMYHKFILDHAREWH